MRCFFGHVWIESYRFFRHIAFQGELIPETTIEMTCRRCGKKEFIEKLGRLIPSPVDEALATMERQLEEMP